MRTPALAAVATALLLTACSSSAPLNLDDNNQASSASSVLQDVSSSDASSSLQAAASSAAVAPTAQEGARVIQIAATNWAFTPNTITVKKGEKVTLEVKGVEGEHGIAIPDLGVDQPIQEGGTVSIVLPTDKAGTFQFRCNVPCGSGHREMTGTIVIEG